MRKKQKVAIILLILIMMFNFLWFNGLTKSNINIDEVTNYSLNLNTHNIYKTLASISNNDEVFRYYINQAIISVLLSLICFIIGMIFLLLHYYVKHNISVLCFAIFVFILSLRMFLISNIPVRLLFPNISGNLIMKMEYLTSFLLLPSVIVFIAYLMHSSKTIYIRNICGGIVGIIITTVIFTGERNYAQFTGPYLYFSMCVVLVSVIIIFQNYHINMFYEAILIISFTNFLIGIPKQLDNDSISWLFIVVFNSVIGFSMILLDQFRKHIKEQEILAINAVIDPLTSLYNRKYLINYSETRFKNTLDSNMSYVLFLDIDGFKKVNDTHGHEIGDEVMQIIGMRLRNCFKETDDIFRYGGDEFVVLTICKDIECMKRKANSVIMSINDPIIIGDTFHQVGISIGITPCESDTLLEFDYYINASDKAMYKVKTNGGNNYEFSQ